MKLYLDSCCYNRPYDDQAQEKIHMEGEAVLTIINRCKQNNDEIIGSSALDLEIDQISDIEMVRFMQQYENGYGDYTEEKYQQPDLSVEEIDIILKTDKNRHDT